MLGALTMTPTKSGEEKARRRILISDNSGSAEVVVWRDFAHLEGRAMLFIDGVLL